MTAYSNLDYGIIGTLLSIILLVGLAARSLKHYFPGGRNLRWYLLSAEAWMGAKRVIELGAVGPGKSGERSISRIGPSGNKP